MIQIRHCRSEDFDSVLALLRQLWPGSVIDSQVARASYMRALAANNQIYLCAENKGHVVGFGSLTLKSVLWPGGPTANVDELVVGEAHRRQGIGAKLIAELVEVARQHGCKRVELDSAHHRTEAHKFYEKIGFENRAALFSKIL